MKLLLKLFLILIPLGCLAQPMILDSLKREQHAGLDSLKSPLVNRLSDSPLYHLQDRIVFYYQEKNTDYLNSITNRD
jgi:hypothetical protein